MKKAVLYIQGVTRYGGAPESLFNLTNRLTKYQGVVATSGEGKLTQRLRRAKVPYFTVKMGMWRKAKSWPFLPGTLYRLNREAKKAEIALIHCNTLWDTPYGVILGRLLKVPVITHIRNTFEKEKIRKYWLDKVDLIITVSEAVARPLKEAGLPFKVVYNGVDLDVFDRVGVSGSEVRRELGLEGSLVILLPGRVDTTKGQREAILAMSRVVKELKQAVLVIVGETSRQEAGLIESLKDLSRKVGVKERVVFTGARDDMPALYAAADLVIMPSLESAKEGFGRVLIEAMAMGKCTVATRTGGIPEVVEEGVTGLLVPPGDEEALARAMLEVLKDKEKRQAMGEAGYNRVLERFDLKRVVAYVERIYDSLL